MNKKRMKPESKTETRECRSIRSQDQESMSSDTM